MDQQKQVYFDAILKAYKVSIDDITTLELTEEDVCLDEELETICCDFATDDLEIDPTIDQPYYDDYALWQQDFLCYLRWLKQQQKQMTNQNNRPTIQ